MERNFDGFLAQIIAACTAHWMSCVVKTAARWVCEPHLHANALTKTVQAGRWNPAFRRNISLPIRELKWMEEAILSRTIRPKRWIIALFIKG
jgi:hypothetical protein